NDQWIRHAGTAAASKNDNSFLDHVLTKEIPENADSTYKANVGFVVETVAGHYALGESPESSVSDYLTKLESTDPVIASAFIRGLAAEWQEGLIPEFNEEEINQLSSLKAVLPEEDHEHLDALSETWGTPNLFGVE
ncbi:MAG: hypothetical protein R3283_10685, partial [Balneolaceae bacterium]|nr:hypothetical protein [Balneolaceae bacterium]